MRTFMACAIILWTAGASAQLTGNAYRQAAADCISESIIVSTAVGVREGGGSPASVLQTINVRNQPNIPLAEKKRIINAVFFNPAFSGINAWNVQEITGQMSHACIAHINDSHYAPLN